MGQVAEAYARNLNFYMVENKREDEVSSKQMNMLIYVIKSNGWQNEIPAVLDDGVDNRWLVLREWMDEKLTRYQLGSLINILEDDEFPEDWRKNFLKDYLSFKQHPNFKS